MKTKRQRKIRRHAPDVLPVRAILKEPDHNSLTAYKCKFCGHKWLPRTNRPESCPNCKRRKWY